MKKFPALFELSSRGERKYWTIEVTRGERTAYIHIKHGLIMGKEKTSLKRITEGKNIGKSNETTPYEQAISEAKAKWKKKKDKGYVENLDELNNEVLLPMLAHSFQKRGHNIKYPAYVQPKLDGVRCLAKKVDSNTIKYYSRMGKEFTTLEHLTPSLLKIMQVDQVLDGEIYSHDMTFQELIRLIKRLRPNSNKLGYHVYDLVDTTKSFEDRYTILKDSFSKFASDHITLLLANTVEDKEEISEKHAEYVAAGYEGVIIRNKAGKYKLKSRSADLQKYKEFKDKEFVITGGKESTGSEVGCIIFDVKNDKGQEFAVRPRGSFSQRRKWMRDINSLIGKKLTVRYQELTDDGIPRFPVGIGIRDYESK